MRITDTQRVLQIVGDLDQLVVGLRDPVLRHIGLNREQWHVLRLLADRQGHRMGEISDTLGLAGATATRVVDSLAQKMLVDRRSDPLDRRRVLIYLGEPGHEILERVGQAFLDHPSSLLAAFEPAERTKFLELLGRLVRPG